MKTIEQFLKELKGDGKSESTLATYRRVLDPYFKWLGGAEPTIDNAEDYVRGKDLKPATVTKYRMAFRTYFNYNGVEIPKGRLKSLRANNVRQDKFVTRKEVDQLHRCADTLRDKVAIRLLFHAGLRAKELLDINIGELDLENQRVYVKGLKESHRVRHVRFIRPELVIPTIRAYLSQRGIDPKDSKNRDTPLLITERETRLSYSRLHSLVGFYGRAIGKPDLSPHWLRHGFVVWNKKHNVPAEITAMQIGDTIKTTQEIYSHYTQTDVDRVYDEIQGKVPEEKTENRNPIDEIEELREENKAMRKRIEERERLEKITTKLLRVVAQRDPNVKREFRRIVKNEGVEDLFE